MYKAKQPGKELQLLRRRDCGRVRLSCAAGGLGFQVIRCPTTQVMPRYYFHLVRGGERITYDEGAELEPADVHPEIMLNVVQNLRTSEDPNLVEEWGGWSVEITDAAGRVLQVILL